MSEPTIREVIAAVVSEGEGMDDVSVAAMIIGALWQNGFAVVPREPTSSMLATGCALQACTPDFEPGRRISRKMWTEMLDTWENRPVPK